MLLTGLRFYKIGREQFIFSYDYTTRYDENGQLIHQERQSYQAEELLNRLSNPHSEEQINNFTQDEILQLQYLIRTIGLETYN